MPTDINFSEENNRFNFRVAAYITYKDQMLIQKDDVVDFFNLPGGRVKINENTNSAIRRELKEELELKDISPKLMYVAENSFTWQGKHVQELLFVYHLELTEEEYKLLPNGKKIANTDSEKIYWVSKTEVKKKKCLPTLIYDLPKLDVGAITHNISIS